AEPPGQRLVVLGPGPVRSRAGERDPGRVARAADDAGGVAQRRVDPPDQGGVVGKGRFGLGERGRLARPGPVLPFHVLLEVEQLPPQLAGLAAGVLQTLLLLLGEPLLPDQAADPLVDRLALAEQVGLARPLLGGYWAGGAAGGLVEHGPGQP